MSEAAERIDTGMLHHNGSGSYAKWVKYNPATLEFYVCLKATGKVYRYLQVPPQHFGNVLTAKSRNEAIGKETPGSEGSYLAHHIGSKTHRPYKYEIVPDSEVATL